MNTLHDKRVHSAQTKVTRARNEMNAAIERYVNAQCELTLAIDKWSAAKETP